MVAKQNQRASKKEQANQREKRKFPFSLWKKNKTSDENTQETDQQKRSKKRKRPRKSRRRIFPIWLRLIVVILLCALALMIGLMIGYGILGDGSPTDILKMDAWKHIVDIVKKEE